MSTRGFWQLEGVADDALVAELQGLLARGARTEARVVAHLAEVESRRLYLRSAKSLFDYCQKRLGLSRNEAFYRIVAARLGQQFPLVFELLERREVHLTSLPLLRDYLTVENHRELLGEATGKTKEQILVALAARSPRPDAKSEIRRLPLKPGQVAAGPTGSLEPLSAVSYRLQLHTSAQLKAKLELAADLMSHSNPQRDLAVVVERALDGLIEQLQQKRFGKNRRKSPTPSDSVKPDAVKPDAVKPDAVKPDAVKPDAVKPDAVKPDAVKPDAVKPDAVKPDAVKPDAVKPDAVKPDAVKPDAVKPDSVKPDSVKPDSVKPDAVAGCGGRKRAHIPRAVRRQLVERDGLGCTFVCDDGQRCGSRAFLEIHHEQAWARGGSDELANLRLVCAAHNRWLAEQEMGRDRIVGAMVSERHRRGRQGGRAA